MVVGKGSKYLCMVMSRANSDEKKAESGKLERKAGVQVNP